MAPEEIQTTPLPSLFPEDQTSELWAQGWDFEYQTCSNQFEIKRYLPSGLLALDPRPIDSSLSTIYPSSYLPYQFHALPPFIRWARDQVQKGKVKVLEKLLRGREKVQIMDVGCGNGTLLHLIQKFGPAEWELHANDLNQESLDRLRAQGFITHSGLLQEIKFETQFDLIILNQVIEHLADVRGILQTIHQQLKPGGMIFIETPSFEGWDARWFQKAYWGGYHFPRHWYLFNEELLARLLREEGFKIEAVDYLASPSFWIQSLHHYFLDRGYPRLAQLFSEKNLLALSFFTGLDLIKKIFGGKTSNMRMMGKK